MGDLGYSRKCAVTDTSHSRDDNGWSARERSFYELGQPAREMDQSSGAITVQVSDEPVGGTVIEPITSQGSALSPLVKTSQTKGLRRRRGRRACKHLRLYDYVIMATVLVLGVVVSALTMMRGSEDVSKTVKGIADAVTETVEHSLLDFEFFNKILGSFVDNVDRVYYPSFVHISETLKDHGQVSTAWFRNVPHQDRAAVEQATSDEWNKYLHRNETEAVYYPFKDGFESTEPVPNASSYVVVRYRYPFLESAINLRGTYTPFKEINGSSYFSNRRTLAQGRRNEWDVFGIGITTPVNDKGVDFMTIHASFQRILDLAMDNAFVPDGIDLHMFEIETPKPLVLTGMRNLKGGVRQILPLADENGVEKTTDMVLNDCESRMIFRTYIQLRENVKYMIITCPNGDYEDDVQASFVIIISLSVILSLVICWLYLVNVKRRQDYIEASENAFAKAQEKVLGFMMHELRNPIHAIRCLAADIVCDSTDPDSKESLELLLATSDHLYALVNGFLDSSKYASTKNIAIGLKPTEILQIVRDVYHQYTVIARSTNSEITLELNVDPCLTHAVVNVDPVRLRQIIGNGLSNAFKATKQGTIQVNVSTENSIMSGEEMKCACLISVVDTGKGLGNVDPESLFQEYVQSEGSYDATQAVPSTGLGLPICRQLVERMGGTVYLRNRTDGFDGAEFVIHLDDCTVANITQTPNGVSLDDAKRCKIALCLDPADQTKLKSNLEHIGVDVKTDLFVFQSIDSLINSLEQQEVTRIDVLMIGDNIEEQHFERIRRLAPTIMIILYENGSASPRSMALQSPPLPAKLFRDAYTLRSSFTLQELNGLLVNDLQKHQMKHRDKSQTEIPHSASTDTKNSEHKHTERSSEKKMDSCKSSQLIVACEDDPVNNVILKRMLKAYTKNSNILWDGEDLLEYLRFGNQLPACILLDIVMKRSSGDDICQKLRAQGYTMPIVALTGNSTQDDIDRYLACGFTHVLTKPYNKHELYHLLDRLLCSDVD